MVGVEADAGCKRLDEGCNSGYLWWQLEAEEQARWEDIRSELAEWHEMGPTEKVRCISRFVECQEEEEEEDEESLPSLQQVVVRGGLMT